MTNTPDYHKATNMAYAVLASLHISSLPVSTLSIIGYCPHLRVIPYTKVCARFGLRWDEYMALNVSERGYICRKGENAIIFYNDTIDLEIIRFTLAHELGHYLLDHTAETSVSDREANCFARNLLCPVPITDHFDLQDIDDCCNLYAVSPPAAKVVLDKRELDRYHITDHHYQTMIQLFDLENITKAEQLNPYSAQTVSAFGDFSAQIYDSTSAPKYRQPHRPHPGYALEWDSVIV